MEKTPNEGEEGVNKAGKVKGEGMLRDMLG